MKFAALSLLSLCCGSALGTEPRIELLAVGSDFPGGALMAADFDGDGDKDLIKLPENSTRQGYDAHGYWLENRGDRAFSPPRLCHLAPTGQNEWLDSPALVKLPGKTRPDFFVSKQNQTSAPFSRDFEPMILSPVLDGPAPVSGAPIAPASPFLWHPVDLEADGITEWAQLDQEGESGPWTLRLREASADGGFRETLALPLMTGTGSFSQGSIRTVDLDGDGDLDLAIHRNYGHLFYFERTSSRGFSATPADAGFDADGDTWVDLNGDGRSDLLREDDTWAENLGALGFAIQPQPPVLEGWRVRNIVPRPGRPAMVWTVRKEESGWQAVNGPFLGNDSPVVRPIPQLPESISLFHFLEDLDGDGHPDLVFSHRLEQRYDSPQRISVCWGSDAGFTAPILIHAAPPFSITTAIRDFDGDGQDDLILGPDGLGSYHFRQNRGRDGLGQPQRLAALEIPGYTVAVATAGDLDADGIIDLVLQCTNPAGTVIAAARGDGKGGFQAPILSSAPSPVSFSGAELVDWDRDGDPDLVSNGDLLENIGGTFPESARHLIDLGTGIDYAGNPIILGFTRTGDLDGDGHPDILSAIYGEAEPTPGSPDAEFPQKMAIGFNDGAGGIQSIVEIPARIAGVDALGNFAVPGNAAIADLDLDGHGDLYLAEFGQSDALGNPTAAARWLRNPGNGSRDPAAWLSQPLPTDSSPNFPSGDFDGDGSEEWVFPGGFVKATPAGPVSMAGPSFTGDMDLSESAFRSAGDLDGDGDSDFIVGGRDGPLLLVTNSMVDGQSPITRALIAAGVSPHLAGPEKDADSDGRNNEAELLTGTSPLEAAPAPEDPFQLGIRLVLGSETLSLRLPAMAIGLPPGPDGQPHTAASLGLYHEIQRSENLQDWSALDRDTAEDIISEDGWIHLSVPISTKPPRAFFRIASDLRDVR